MTLFRHRGKRISGCKWEPLAVKHTLRFSIETHPKIDRFFNGFVLQFSLICYGFVTIVWPFLSPYFRCHFVSILDSFGSQQTWGKMCVFPRVHFDVFCVIFGPRWVLNGPHVDPVAGPWDQNGMYLWPKRDPKVHRKMKRIFCALLEPLLGQIWI